MGSSLHPFFVKTCSLAAIATGERASSLLELRDKLLSIDEGCIYYHFWGGRMNAKFTQSQYHNDFAGWAHLRLHDHVLAEKLSVIDPTEHDHLESLRQEILEVVESRLDDYEIVLWTKREDQFYFIRSTIIVFESKISIERPLDLPFALEKLPPSSIFYHFIDARMRTQEKQDDFSVWLRTNGDHYEDLIEKIQSIDPYFLSLTELRDELVQSTRQYFEEKDRHG